MQEISTIHHLVHVGFGGPIYDHQKNLPERIKKRIEQVSFDATSVINFVDEVLPSKEEVEIMQIISLVEILSCFIVSQVKPSDIIEERINNLLYKHPKQIVDFLYDSLDGKWQKLGDADNTESVDEYLKRVLGEGCGDMLFKLVEGFKGQNMFEIKYGEQFTTSTPACPSRREELYDFAINKLGEKRVIVSGMDDGDINNIVYVNKPCVPDSIKKIKIGVLEEYYANAVEYISSQSKKRVNGKYLRLKEAFSKTIESRGLCINDDTMHILGGEYAGRCVGAYGDILGLYGINPSNILSDYRISLFHPNDTHRKFEDTSFSHETIDGILKQNSKGT